MFKYSLVYGFLNFLYILLFYACLELRFLDVVTNSGPQRAVPGAYRILCSNVRAFPRTWAMWQQLRLSMICCCALRPWSLTGIIYQSCWILDLVVRSCCERASGMAANVRDGYAAFRQPKFECGCCEMLVFRMYGARQNFYVFSLYHNLDLADRIYDCLLTAMAAVQAADAHASFLFVGDLNIHH